MKDISFSLILGNILGFLCSSFCILSTFYKNKDKIIKIQSIACLCNILSCLVLHGYSGVITQLISLTRNIIIIAKGEINKILQIIFLVMIIIAGVVANNKGIIGIFPIIASVEYSVVVMTSKSGIKIKLGLATNNFFWSVYHFIIRNYMGMLLSLVIVIMSLYNVIRNILTNRSNKRKALEV